MSAPSMAPKLHGLLAEFKSPRELVKACESAHHAGYRRMDAFTPYPIEAVWEAIGHHRSRVPLIVLIGSLAGAIGGYGLQYWVSSIVYPLNVGGRPYNSWPAFIPVTFECAILLGGISAVIGMILINGLPRPHHPLWNVPEFVRASRDGYFLCIEAEDPKFDRKATGQFLESLEPMGVHEVED